ncbi:CPBP family intramembrane metalloprotease [Aetokthonos hydrillicola Thurmond2011]|uniref:CPBP family intramembrane metalloprotease n=1 Tax=Aetokthonos hydrillicola Thurmond2011 TaxID=2712845 RepID=A0AAP5I1Y3_9CYAN|nr:CPBP family intramembrane metalloprotease [Aetokthonos hydrillicola Thurmond2011]
MIKNQENYFRKKSIVFVVISLFKSSANYLLLLSQNVPVVVVVMAFFVTWIISWLPVAAILATALKWQLNKPFQPEQKLPLVISLYFLAPLIIWGVLWFTNQHLINYGFVWNISILVSVVLGFALGVLGLSVVFVSQISLGWCSFQSSNTKQLRSVSLPILLVALFVGGIEELVFRGFLLTELNHDYSVWVAAVASSIVFAVLHLIWEQKETIPQLPGLWLMGMVLVFARFVDGGILGLAWGLHAGWVWAIACLDTAQLITYTGKVPEWVTGKNNKPLAGLAGIACLLLTAAILWLFHIYI